MWDIIVKADVMTGLLGAIRGVGAQLMSLFGQSGDAVDEVQDVLVLLLDLLCSVCESSADAVESFNRLGLDLVPPLTKLLEPPALAKFPHAAHSAAQCLHVLSEENPAVSAAIASSPTALPTLHAVLGGEGAAPPVVVVLAAGVLVNLGPAAHPAGHAPPSPPAPSRSH